MSDEKREQVHLTVLRSDGQTEAHLAPQPASKSLDAYDGLSLEEATKKAKGSKLEALLMPMLIGTQRRVERRRSEDVAAKDLGSMELKVEHKNDGRRTRA